MMSWVFLSSHSNNNIKFSRLSAEVWEHIFEFWSCSFFFLKLLHLGIPNYLYASRWQLHRLQLEVEFMGIAAS